MSVPRVNFHSTNWGVTFFFIQFVFLWVFWLSYMSGCFIYLKSEKKLLAEAKYDNFEDACKHSEDLERRDIYLICNKICDNWFSVSSFLLAFQIIVIVASYCRHIFKKPACSYKFISALIFPLLIIVIASYFAFMFKDLKDYFLAIELIIVALWLWTSFHFCRLVGYCYDEELEELNLEWERRHTEDRQKLQSKSYELSSIV
jgi:hypothetical protein